MNLEDIHTHIRSIKNDLDNAIKLAAQNYYSKHKSDSNFLFDVKETSKECYLLSKGADLCYDRPSIGFSYSLWYQGRRVNSFLKYLSQAIFEARNEQSITIYDLGAGTGAIQWACAAVISSFKKYNIKAPVLKIINIDTSPFMLDYNRQYLWPALVSLLGEVQNTIIPSYFVNSWNSDVDEFDYSNSWITASYLFDHTENSENLKKDFKKLIEKIKPSKILLTSSYNKKEYTKTIVKELEKNNYLGTEVNNNLIYTGNMPATVSIRRWFNDNASCNFQGTPIWNENYIYGVICSSTSPIFDLFPSDTSNSINLYNPPLLVRRDITLNETQKKAAQNDNRPTIIVGPAGCGKSVVITQRVLNIIDDAIKISTVNKTRILLTTFNKELKNYLLNWVKDLFDSKNITYTENCRYGLKTKGSDYINIFIMHFDVLPTRLWEPMFKVAQPFNDTLLFESKLLIRAKEAINNIKKSEKITSNEYDNVLNPEYILDEYNRVIYGQNYTKVDTFLTSIRSGRPTLKYNSIRRKLLFKTVQKLLEIMENNNESSIITRRHKLLKELDKRNFKGYFTHVFVDEFQDCTQSDYDIFYNLLKDPNNLIIAGDFAQAVHLGRVAATPRVDASNGERMRNRVIHRLDGSYRLPYRISEAIKPLSEAINKDQESADIITPYKGAPPGARPILVFAENNEELAIKLIRLANAFQAFDVVDITAPFVDKITILEKDVNITRALNTFHSGIADTDTILRLKGLEKKLIVWSTNTSISHTDEIKNFIYTIFTRTSGLLIIAMFNNIQQEYKDIITSLRKDRIMLWDEASASYYNNLLKINI
ncbi:UvrD-helicase domain-containing protein [uncultured Aquimarina sp.]|uniref:UvrD-helicase domain-containing protein n=1 Tax=uncultured Aquimarina sp. TaxID=575652 RepID=UPI00261BAE74|nr:UvrD-helicase domain-containing protein [uncultured Aquimarina sp.]